MKYLLLLSGLLLYSCSSILKLWYKDRDSVERPKKPRYKLAYKEDFKPPKQLDTLQVYSLAYEANDYDGIVFPRYDYADSIRKSNIKDKQCTILSIKFYPDSRCLLFNTPNNEYPRVYECYMNRNGLEIVYSGKDYYYSKDGKIIEIESYIYGDGIFSYYKFNYELTESGDTLIYRGKDYNAIRVYVRSPLPNGFKEPLDSW